MTEYFQAIYKSHIFPASVQQMLLNLLAKGKGSSSDLRGTHTKGREAAHVDDLVTVDDKEVAIPDKPPDMVIGMNLTEQDKLVDIPGKPPDMEAGISLTEQDKHVDISRIGPQK